jgi:hypothetical protein
MAKKPLRGDRLGQSKMVWLGQGVARLLSLGGERPQSEKEPHFFKMLKFPVC